MTPFYLRYLGPEEYGLVGVFTMLATWFALFDFGLSPMISRKVAFDRGKLVDIQNTYTFFKTIEALVICVLLIAASTAYTLSNSAISGWLNYQYISPELVHSSISIMILISLIRLAGGIYRSVLVGLEDQVWLSNLMIVLAIFKYIGGLVVIVYGGGINDFFTYQLILAFIEVLILLFRAYSGLKRSGCQLKVLSFDVHSLIDNLPFALRIGYGALVWVAITQADKVMLSSMLTLENFGYYSLIALVVSVLIKLGPPLGQAVGPRMASLCGGGEYIHAISLYGKSTQFITLLSFSTALALGLYAEPLFLFWTGNIELSVFSKDITLFFAIGNAFIPLSLLLFQLQQALGDLRLHVYGATINLFFQLPIIYFSVLYGGVLGAGIAWLSIRVFWFFSWTWIVHKNVIHLCDFHLRWLFGSFFIPLIPVSLLSYLLYSSFTSLFDLTDSVLIFIAVFTFQVVISFLAGLSITMLLNLKSDFFALNGEWRKNE